MPALPPAPSGKVLFRPQFPDGAGEISAPPSRPGFPRTGPAVAASFLARCLCTAAFYWCTSLLLLACCRWRQQPCRWRVRRGLCLGRHGRPAEAQTVARAHQAPQYALARDALRCPPWPTRAPPPGQPLSVPLGGADRFHWAPKRDNRAPDQGSCPTGARSFCRTPAVPAGRLVAPVTGGSRGMTTTSPL